MMEVGKRNLLKLWFTVVYNDEEIDLNYSKGHDDDLDQRELQGYFFKCENKDHILGKLNDPF